MFNPVYGGFVLELAPHLTELEGAEVVGTVISKYSIVAPEFKLLMLHLTSVEKAYEQKLEPVYPVQTKTPSRRINTISYKFDEASRPSPAIKVAKPRVLIPVFPGTNCEYDTARVFERAGALPQVFVVRNRNAAQIEESIQAFAQAIRESQIIMIPGGFSGGDEPDGSGKFITSFFRNPLITEEVENLLGQRDGLMLGICNGFQALVKLGLVPFGHITENKADNPTLTFNNIGRHQSKMVRTRIASNKSPWLAGVNVGDIHTVPISHGEGKFVCSQSLLQKMAFNGQIATQYVDLDDEPTYQVQFNPNTSVMAIEGITSPDGRVLGKMGHSERIGKNICKNVPGEKDQKIFQSGVEYFTK